VYGGKENLKQGRSNYSKKKKIVVAVEIDKNRGVKRAYFKKIENHSSKELSNIFDCHISSEAKVTTDKWKGYLPLKSNMISLRIRVMFLTFLRPSVKSWFKKCVFLDARRAYRKPSRRI
jgi:hypothetical protein